jgi:hypothetical protein
MALVGLLVIEEAHPGPPFADVAAASSTKRSGPVNYLPVITRCARPVVPDG